MLALQNDYILGVAVIALKEGRKEGLLESNELKCFRGGENRSA